MIIGYDFFNGSCFDTPIAIGNIYRMELQNCIVDEVKIDEGNNVSNSFIKEEWGLFTLLRATFQDNLEAGNLTNAGMPIEKIKIKKRKIEDLTWSEIKEFAFDKTQKIYEFEDKYVESGEEYEFAILPVTSNIEGGYTIADIVCNYNGTWLMDKTNSFKLIYELQYGDIESVIPSSDIETMGGQYPITTYAGKLNYRKGNIQCLLATDETIDTGEINVRQEKLLRRAILSLLNNKKPKLLKDNSGYFMVVNLKDIKEVPNNDTKRKLYGVSFTFTEAAGTTIEDLKNSGLY